MQYEQALREWGATKIREQIAARAEFAEKHSWARTAEPDENAEPVTVEASEVSVTFEVEDCWHTGGSMDQGASTTVVISAWDSKLQLQRVEIAASDFDFAKVLGEIVAAADGTVTA